MLLIGVLLLGVSLVVVSSFKERYWLKRLAQGDIEERLHAGEVLAAMGSLDALPMLLDMAGDAGDEILSIPLLLLREPPRRAMRSAESIVNQCGDRAVPHLRKALREGYWTVRWRAAQLLASLGIGAKDAIPDLIRALELHPDDRRAAICHSAEAALVAIGRPAIPAVVQLLQGDRPALCRRSILVAIGPDSVPELVAFISRSEGRPRLDAISCLAQIGPPAGLAGPKLRDLLEHHSDEAVRSLAGYALACMGLFSDSLIDSAREQLGSSRDSIRHCGARIFALLGSEKLGRRAAEAVPLLVDALKDPSQDVRAFAACALERLGSVAAPAVPALRAALTDENHRVHSCAIDALTKIQGKPSEARAAGCDECVFYKHPED
jgi:HEAT repeat protein